MPSRRSLLGARGERLAQAFLRSRGYHILEANYRCREGEIDVVTQVKDTLVFVEVRTRQGGQLGTPEESITPEKERRLVALAQGYLQSHQGLPPEWRIDVVAVELDARGRLSRLELIENAVSERSEEVARHNP